MDSRHSLRTLEHDDYLAMRADAVICWALVLSLPATLPLAWLSWPTAPLPGTAWAAFGYVSVFSMWLGFFAWYQGLALGGTVRVSQVQLIQPFLGMLFAVPPEEFVVDEEVVRALDLLLILHADHEQNCSTSTVRLVGSSQANLFASIAAGICALWGRLHGGANQEVIEMLQMIHEDGDNVDKYIAMAKDKKSDFRLMGFGHRVYKNFDPRAKIIKRACDSVLTKMGVHDPLLDIAKKLEERALSDSYFVDHKLYPNVDFYSGIIYKAIGIPNNMFTVMFALGRLPGWIAHWKEMTESGAPKIGRPRQIYTGPTLQNYVPLEARTA